MPLRAGWVPCIGLQPLAPKMINVEGADEVTKECEKKAENFIKTGLFQQNYKKELYV